MFLFYKECVFFFFPSFFYNFFGEVGWFGDHPQADFYSQIWLQVTPESRKSLGTAQN
jgi:hypothetical protein